MKTKEEQCDLLIQCGIAKLFSENSTYLLNAIEKLNLNGVYFTPEIIKTKIKMDETKAIIGNPPFKTIK